MPSTLSYHSINNSIKAKSTRGSGTSLRNSVSIVGNLNFQKSFAKNHKKEVSNTLCVSQNKDSLYEYYLTLIVFVDKT